MISLQRSLHTIFSWNNNLRVREYYVPKSAGQDKKCLQMALNCIARIQKCRKQSKSTKSQTSLYGNPANPD